MSARRVGYGRYLGGPRGRLITSVILFFFVAALSPLAPLVGTARAQGEEDLADAQRRFEMLADYEGALAIADRLVAAKTLQGSALRDAHILRARCLLAMDRDAEGQDAFCDALRTDRAWRPDEFEYTRKEIQVFSAALATCPAEVPDEDEDKGGGPPWKIIAVAGIALVAGVVLALGGGDDEKKEEEQGEDLPDFPDPPTN